MPDKSPSPKPPTSTLPTPKTGVDHKEEVGPIWLVLAVSERCWLARTYCRASATTVGRETAGLPRRRSVEKRRLLQQPSGCYHVFGPLPSRLVIRRRVAFHAGFRTGQRTR